LKNVSGAEKFGLTIEGLDQTDDAVYSADLPAVAGTTLVNVTIRDFLKEKPLFFYRTTIAGAAHLMEVGQVLCSEQLRMISFLLLSFGGLTAGTLGGLLGIGGGILIMPLLRFIVGLEPAESAGTCVVAVFFTTLGGSLRHFSMGHIHPRSIIPVVLSGFVSTLICSLFFVYLSRKGAWLDAAIGVVFLLVAMRMLWEGICEYLKNKSTAKTGGAIQGSILSKVTIGAAAGVLPGLLGIGTGAILVPAFAFALSAPIKVAIGSSLACFSLNALVSSALKLFQGFVQVGILIPLCIGTLIGSRFGATLNGRFSSPVLKGLFGVFFGCVAGKYLGVLGV